MEKELFERYESIADFVNTIESRKTQKAFECKMTSQRVEKGDEPWSGTNTYEEAKDLLLHGDRETQKKIESTAIKLHLNGNGNETRNKLYNSPCGFLPVVPKVLAGDPQNMLAIKKQQYKSSKVLNIIFSCALDCTLDGEDTMKASCKLINAIRQLEKNGYRINLYTCQLSSQPINRYDRQYYGYIIKVKDSGKYLDTLRLAYPLANPAFHRRHALKAIETKAGLSAKWMKCYGYPVQQRKQIEKFLNGKIKYNCLVHLYDILNKDTKEIAQYIENAK